MRSITHIPTSTEIRLYNFTAPDILAVNHRPIHVHVRYGSGEAVSNVEGEVELRDFINVHVNRSFLPLRQRSWGRGLGRGVVFQINFVED